MSVQRVATSLLLACICWTLVACGGGGGGGSSSAAPVPTAVTYPPSAASLNDPNVSSITVERWVGGHSNVNIPYVTVTVCAPGGVVGSGNCKSIDHVLLDTASFGLRLFANAVSAAPALALPAQTIGGSALISECADFANSVSAWGSVKLADVVMAGERAHSVPVQLMDASATGSGNCANLAYTRMSTTTLSANGILGVGRLTNDRQSYFNCTAACVQIFPTASQQVQNPVGLFAIDNNGVLVQLPALDAGGAVSVPGYLVFGVATQTNNQLGAANIVPLNGAGQFTTVYRGVTMASSFMDSGSNGLFFTDPNPQVLAGTCTNVYFFCPGSTQTLSASIQLSGAIATVGFSIANADTLFASGGKYAYNNLGGPAAGSSFDWGLPFFFGRSVYTVIENTSVSGVAAKGPWNAFTN